MQAGMLGMLASLPLLAWALVSPLAQGLASRIGLDAAVSWALVALLGATIWRSLPGSPINLWLGTAWSGAKMLSVVGLAGGLVTAAAARAARGGAGSTCTLPLKSLI